MKVLVKEPFAKPYIKDIPNSLESLQNEVGGCIETVTVATDWTIICNENGRIIGLPDNCILCGHDFVGTILIVGVNGEDFTDFPFTEKQTKIVFYELWE